jgi:phosphohistidine swiveling domain-containing protein
MKHEVNFTVEPDFVVRFVRDKVLSKDWRGALRTLTSLPVTLDDAVALLRGDLTLVDAGNGQVVLAEQPNDCPDLKRYLNTAHWQNAGILERNGEFYQPYAEITGFTWQDLDPVMTRLRELEDWCTMREFRDMRARHYVDTPFDDIVCFDTGTNPVIFKRVQGPPFWMKTFEDAAEAVKDCLAAKRHIEVRGGGSGSCNAASVEFYLKPARDGFLLKDFDAVVQGEEGEMLERIMEMRDRFDNRDDSEDDPWYSDESRFQDAVSALYWKWKVDQAAETNGGFMEIVTGCDEDEDKVTYRIARIPFLWWAYERRRHEGVLPHWDIVCPSGMKMYGDNPLHTDWWVSSGLALKQAYDHDHPLNQAAWKIATKWQYTEGAKCIKLAGKGKVSGPIVFPKPNEAVPAGSIAVVSHAGPDYQLALTSACKGDSGAVIAQVGGKLAHLAIVSREMGARLVVIDEALTTFKEGELVTLDLDNCDVLIHGRVDDDAY